MTRRPGTGGTRRQAPGAAPSAPGSHRPSTNGRLALPADLGRSLRLLDDDALDRLVKAAMEEAPAARTRRDTRFRGRKQAVKTTANEERTVRPDRRRDAGTEAPDPGRLRSRPLACGHRAGIPALAANRPACYHRCATRPPQDGAIRWSREHRRTDMPWNLNARASAAKTGGGARYFQRTAESRHGLGLQRSARSRPARSERTGRNAIEGPKTVNFRAS